MKTFFDTAADSLPTELQTLRETLWACWEDDLLPPETWLKQIGSRACPEPAAAFQAYVETGVLVQVGEKFKLDKDA